MKTILFILAAAITPAALAADYSVFRVCEDKHVIRTADGAEAGHVEYIVLDPESREVVSTVVTGGVIGSRFVAVPFSSMQFSAGNDIALTEITRERLVAAPVIERTQFTTNVIAPATIERTYNYFGVQAAGTARTGVQQSTEVTTQSTRGQAQPVEGTAATRSGTQETTTQPGTAPGTQKSQTAERRRGARQQQKNPAAVGERTTEQSGTAAEKSGTAPEKPTQGTEPTKSGQSGRGTERATERSQRRTESGEARQEGTRSTEQQGGEATKPTERQSVEKNRPAEGQRESGELNRPTERQSGEATHSSEQSRGREQSGTSSKEQPSSTSNPKHKEKKPGSEEPNR